MTSKAAVPGFFIAGGTLPLEATYVERPMDGQLLAATLAGEFCNVLTPRQMGKSSLMVRTAAQLRAHGVQTAIIDLTRIGTKISDEEWYYGLINKLKTELNLVVDNYTWWYEHTPQSLVQRFSGFLQDVILVEIQEPIVIFVDEIDSTLELPFADDFFAAIRAAYNARATEPVYKRLTFVLLGVARPADLIKNRARTPYNVGQSIDLRDFTLQEAQIFLPGLKAVSPAQAQSILKHVLCWTGGHPYLTQKVCAMIAGTLDSSWTEDQIDQLVKQLFLSDEARKESNLQYISDRIRESPDREKLLAMYSKVLAHKNIIDEERDPIKSQLKLIGLLKVTPQGTLTVRNRIYEAAFNAQWIKQNLPTLTWTQITTLIAVAIAIIFLAAGIFILYRQQNSNQIQAEAYIEDFRTTQSPAVQLTSLAGLFRLDGEFTFEARKLFFGLATDQQVTMFTGLKNAEEVGLDLQVVIKGIYTKLENNDHHNTLLRAMSDKLDSIKEKFPDSPILNSEIKAWLDGRRQFQAGNFQTAVEMYSQAISYYDQNPAIYLDRSLANIELGQYEDALSDLTHVAELDSERQVQVTKLIQSDAPLRDYLKSHPGDFSTLAKIAL